MQKRLKSIYKSILICTFLGVLIIILPLSCENNNEIDLYGVEICDSTNITWNSKIADILYKNCVSCHGPEISYNGVRHDSYAEEMKVVLDGRLKGVINHLPGYSKMPKDRDILPECELLVINKWIANGAPEN